MAKPLPKLTKTERKMLDDYNKKSIFGKLKVKFKNLFSIFK